jgi:WD40 repeat protein
MGNLLQWSLATQGSRSLGEPMKGKVLRIGTTDGGKGLIAIATRQAAVFDLDAKPLHPKPIDLPFPEISSAVLSVDGNQLAIGSPEGGIAVLDRKVSKWSAPMIDTTLRREVIDLAFHPKGTWLAASYGFPPVEGRAQPIVLWNLSTGKREDPPFVGHRFEVMSLDFSPDARQLASGSWDQDVRLWDIGTRRTIPPVLVKAAQEVGSIQYDNGPTQVAISPDGEMLASVMKDSVALWDMANHKGLARFTGLIHGTTLAFSRKDKLIAVGGQDKNIILIPTDFEYWLRAACGVAPRPFTADEKRYYLGEARNRGAVAAWLWDMYWSIRFFSGDSQHRRGVAKDPC